VDIGLALIRVVIGVLLVGHGAGKLFGWFVKGGLVATTQYFASLRYPLPKLMAVLAGSTEVAAGVGIGAGFLTPLAAAAIVAVMVNAAVAGHARQGLWSENDGYEYALVLAIVVTGIALIGPGRYSIDASLGWSWGSSVIVAAVVVGGLLAGVAMLLARRAAEDASADPASHQVTR
jgi:putative oxidoreductase